jgi:uncharacterized protein YbjQ (UPF0145 family)
MAFLFGRPLSESREERERRRARRQESEDEVARGGLPLDATERLTGMAARQGTPAHLFTATLSPNEFLLARECGFAPLGQVMGCSVGYTAAPGSSAVSGELKMLTRAFHDIQERALGRLRQEARLLGASGVVGVRLERRMGLPVADAGETIEFVAVGTAVREANRPRPPAPSAEGALPEPFLSALSGQDLFALRCAGWRPVGLVVGNCAYYRVAKPPAQYSAFASVEREDYTECLYRARSLAMDRLHEQAALLRAEGVVGVTVSSSHRFVEGGNITPDMACHFFVAGTAIARAPGPPPGRDAPLPVVSLAG